MILGIWAMIALQGHLYAQRWVISMRVPKTCISLVLELRMVLLAGIQEGVIKEAPPLVKKEGKLWLLCRPNIDAIFPVATSRLKSVLIRRNQ